MIGGIMAVTKRTHGAQSFQHNVLAEYIQRWGNGSSVALFDSASLFFSTPDIEGVIGYRKAGNVAVVFGDPVCARSDMPLLLQAFTHYCKEHGWRATYIAVSDWVCQWVLQHKKTSAVHFASEVIINPTIDPQATTGHDARALRNKHNQCVRDGIAVKEYKGNDSAIEKAMSDVAQAWLQGRKGPQISLASVDTFFKKASNRFFYTEHNGAITGVLLLHRLNAYAGWLMNILMVAPDAHNATSEFLLMQVLAVLREEKCSYLTTGPSPCIHPEGLPGLNAIARMTIRLSFRIVKKVFQLNNRQRYWKKFNPRKEPMFVAFANSRVGLCEIVAILRAFKAGK
jgi:lysylphosphatidylglycerol synthetase-like protein (DUF2156 family)